VRSSSQQLRDSIERDMAHDYLASQKEPIPVTTVSFLYESKSPPPLSWHLTKEQIADIGHSWTEENKASWRQIRTFLKCSCDDAILKTK
jgi:hypothetical protein